MRKIARRQIDVVRAFFHGVPYPHKDQHGTVYQTREGELYYNNRWRDQLVAIRLHRLGLGWRTVVGREEGDNPPAVVGDYYNPQILCSPSAYNGVSGRLYGLFSSTHIEKQNNTILAPCNLQALVERYGSTRKLIEDAEIMQCQTGAYPTPNHHTPDTDMDYNFDVSHQANNRVNTPFYQSRSNYYYHRRVVGPRAVIRVGSVYWFTSIDHGYVVNRRLPCQASLETVYNEVLPPEMVYEDGQAWQTWRALKLRNDVVGKETVVPFRMGDWFFFPTAFSGRKSASMYRDMACEFELKKPGHPTLEATRGMKVPYVDGEYYVSGVVKDSSNKYHRWAGYPGFAPMRFSFAKDPVIMRAVFGKAREWHYSHMQGGYVWFY